MIVEIIIIISVKSCPMLDIDLPPSTATPTASVLLSSSRFLPHSQTPFKKLHLFDHHYYLLNMSTIRHMPIDTIQSRNFHFQWILKSFTSIVNFFDTLNNLSYYERNIYIVIGA